MGLFWKDQSNRMVEDYVREKKEGKNTLSKTGILLFDKIIHQMETNQPDAYNYLYDVVVDKNIESIEQIFEDDRQEVLEYLLGIEYAEKYRYYLSNMKYYPYSQGYYRRSVRTESALMLLSKALDDFKSFFSIVASGLSWEVILQGGTTEDESIFIKDIDYSYPLSVEIDKENQIVISQIKDILCSENNSSGIVTYNLLKGIVMSRNQELYELEGKLLLAARLQEGLRQSIAETMDSGRPEAFIYLFNVIRTNDLQRFSSIKRAAGTWTGLFAEADADRINQKTFDLIYHMLTDSAYAEACLQSEDSIEVYLALWVRGFYKVEVLYPVLVQILEGGIKHRIQVLFFYIRASQFRNWQRTMSAKALELYHDDMSIIASYIDSYLEGLSMNSYYFSKKDSESYSYFNSVEEAGKHYEILKHILGIMKEKQTFSPFIFPWYSTEITKHQIIEKMACIGYLHPSRMLVDDLCSYYGQMSVYTREHFLELFLSHPEGELQKQLLTKALGDRAEGPRNQAYKILSEIEIDVQQYEQMEELLKYKSGDLRQNAIKLLLKQPPSQLKSTICRLLSDTLTDKRLGGLDILLNIRSDKDYTEIFKDALTYVKDIPNPAVKEQLLIDQLTGKKENLAIYSKENGFCLYNPEDEIILPLIPVDGGFDIKATFSLLQEGSFLKKLFGGKTGCDPFYMFEKLHNLFTQHSQYEYETKYGQTVLMGNVYTRVKDSGDEDALNDYPLPDVWKAFYQENIKDYPTLFQLLFVIGTEWNSTSRNGMSVYEFMDKEFLPQISRFYDFNLKDLKLRLEKLPHYDKIVQVLRLLGKQEKDEKYAFNTALNILNSFLPLLDKGKARKEFKFDSYQGTQGRTIFLYQHNTVDRWLSDNFMITSSEEDFVRSFTTRYHYYQQSDYLDTDPINPFPKGHLHILDFGKALGLGIIPESEVMKELLVRINAPNNLEFVSSYLSGKMNHWRLREFKQYEGTDFSALWECMQKVTDRLLDIELKRGDSATDVSHLVMKLERVEGTAVWVALLKAFGKDTFERTGYSYSSTFTKKEVLSKLLRNCYPAEDDSAETLRTLLEGSGISDERLVEAGMYAPQWIEIIEKCIDWKGLNSVAYYFHAHINEWCDDRKKAVIARFTPIDPDDLRQGAFDLNWFKEAYEEIGDKRFEVVYDAAKYISSGASHTRARKYADAVNGKMEPGETKKEIIAKRNKDLLMAYCLIPFGKKRQEDMLERYQYLQQFLKESKSFGSQRQDSEKKAVEIAMQNLARNAGYDDVTRLTWSMETALIKDMKAYFTPRETDGVEVYVDIDEEGKSTVRCMKGGKELNSVPAKLKKNLYIAELREVNKKLKDQYSRSRIMLEQSMEDGTPFLIRELEELTQNPVVWPLLKHLVLITDEGKCGFYADYSLVSPDGKKNEQKPETKIRIAHPVDLYNSGLWSDYQKYFFDNKLRQPYKQVFRELYVKTEEEKDMQRSLRYAGNQIQPRKTVAVLKGRRWVANYEEGLQKVYFKENIVASIYALADWFSPADIEAPTLEWVVFYHRKTNESIPIGKVPEIIFSEVMRDVDLAVSVAHVGGVDPETSHSTMEMRRVIVEFTLPLLKLTNVRLEGKHAFISGSMGNYTVHLGSGVIHQEAGAAIAVLPVHSQHRGRLFLPFVDEDPKTAEILSKIILFAEDQKIKDPFILNQIKRK